MLLGSCLRRTDFGVVSLTPIYQFQRPGVSKHVVSLFDLLRRHVVGRVSIRHPLLDELSLITCSFPIIIIAFFHLFDWLFLWRTVCVACCATDKVVARFRISNRFLVMGSSGLSDGQGI